MKIPDWIYPDEHEEAIIILCLKNWAANSKPAKQRRQRLLHQANMIFFIGSLKSSDLLESDNCPISDAWLGST